MYEIKCLGSKYKYAITLYVVIQSLSCAWLLLTPWTASRQASLSHYIFPITLHYICVCVCFVLWKIIIPLYLKYNYPVHVYGKGCCEERTVFEVGLDMLDNRGRRAHVLSTYPIIQPTTCNYNQQSPETN